MPVVLLAALAGSLLIHGAALFGTDFELFGEAPETLVLQAELQLPPAPPAAVVAPPAAVVAPPPDLPPPPPPPKPPKPRPLPAAARTPQPAAAAPVVRAPLPTAEAAADASGETVAAAVPSPPPSVPPPPPPPPAAPAPVLPASGTIRFVIIKESLGLRVGRAEQHWEFAADGSYRLHAVSETSGLAAFFRPARVEMESRGRLVAGGLRPESFRSRRADSASEEGADFDWEAGQLHLLRDGSRHRLAPGAQDILSLNYQLAYLGQLAEGAGLGVATARKYERQQLDALGEEEIEVPAGHFRTLHLQALTDSATEIWIALDHGCLPVKIRYTDKNGDSFEQVATELGL